MQPTQSTLSLFPSCTIPLTRTAEGEYTVLENLFCYAGLLTVPGHWLECRPRVLGLAALQWPVWHALSLQILVLWSPKNNHLFAIHLHCCHCCHAWNVCLGFSFCTSLKRSSLGNYYATCKNKGKNTDLPDLGSTLWCLKLVPARISGDRDLHSCPLLPWHHLSMPAKAFVPVLKTMHGLTPSSIAFLAMNPADSEVLWRLHWPQS